MKVDRDKANQEHKKRKKTELLSKTVESESQRTNSSLMAEFYGIECSEGSVLSSFETVVSQ